MSALRREYPDLLSADERADHLRLVRYLDVSATNHRPATHATDSIWRELLG